MSHLRVFCIHLCCFILFSFNLQSETVDIITFYDYSKEPAKLPLDKFDFRMFGAERIAEAYADGSSDIKKIVVINYVLEPNSPVFKQPKEKLIYILMEPDNVDASYFEHFSRVYSWDDARVDEIKHFKINYPNLMPMIDSLPAFKDKKFCAMVASNMTKPRIEMILFFENKPEGDFDFFGFRKVNCKSYRGTIPGGHSDNGKISTLKNYKFCICFENTTTNKGYITEKIFGCFASGCVPIYWGAPNIQSYIPRGCFIDYRDFKNNEELYLFLKAMTEEEYNKYLECIRSFLKSKEAQLFSPKAHEEIFLDALKS